MSASRGSLWVACTLLCTAQGCDTPSPAQDRAGRGAVAEFPFSDATAAAGIRFRHVRGGQSPFTILHTAGSGCAFFDYDGDGWLDVVLLSHQTVIDGGRPSSTVVLYRNRRDGTFTDVTAAARVRTTASAMGCAVGDYDGDGDLDLYVTSFGPNLLYRNNADGTFTDVTATAGPAAGGWSTSAAFSDYDGDGDLDLYVTRYVRFDEHSKQLCSVRGVLMACAPVEYPGQSGILYRNTGGVFTDATHEAGVFNPSGKGLGVVWGDYNGDGRPDLYVANDAAANNLFRNTGGGRFRDVGLIQGVAYGPDGSAEGSMGVDAGDYDNDGLPDILVTNFQSETNALYHSEGDRGFTYASFPAGIGEASLPMVGFGAGFLDFDSDGDLDIFTANGHVQDTIRELDPTASFPQPRQLYENMGAGMFRDATSRCGPALTLPAVGRGAAFGDYDNDGDVDVLVNNNGGAPLLLRNNLDGRRRWLRVRLLGKKPNTSAVGARVTVETGRLKQWREVRSGYSYASASDFRLHFGLSDAGLVDAVRIRWPDGSQTVRRNVRTNEEIAVRQEDSVI